MTTLAWEGIENARELGGLRREDGARIREGLLLRTGHLARASDGDVAALADMGLYAVIDFRDGGERRRDPDRDVPGAAYYHLPALPDLSGVFDPPDSAHYTPQKARDDFHRLYRYLALSPESQEAYARFFQILLASEGKPVLWHCTQGKDRTGAAALLLMTALGFDREAAVEEYLRTNACMQKQLDAYAARGHSPDEVALAREVLLVREENIRFYLRCIELEYLSTANYIELALGIGPGETEKLENFYLA